MFQKKHLSITYSGGHKKNLFSDPHGSPKSGIDQRVPVINKAILYFELFPTYNSYLLLARVSTWYLC
jgi:hypothetical protein